MSEDTGSVPVRQCPTRVDSHRPLISHLITLELCLTRQGENYHKCTRCQFRGAALTEFTVRMPEVTRVVEPEQANSRVPARPAKAPKEAEAGT